MNVELFDAEMTIDESLIDASPAEIRAQVNEYLGGTRREFDLSVSVPDDFTGQVMTAMAEIPYGETRTYGDLATVLDTAPVAVGGACGRNRVPIIVPCHRVVGANSLGGFSTDCADPIALKRRLLEAERNHADGDRERAIGEGASDDERGRFPA